MVPRSALPFDDLCTTIAWANTHAGALFTAGERVVLARIVALPADSGELYARLSLRVGDVFFRDALAYECAGKMTIDQLLEAGLATELVPDDRVLTAATMIRMKATCARLGLPTGGRRFELEQRLRGLAWCTEPVLMTRHRSLLWRCERIGGFDRSLAPVDRIAGTTWAEYAPTGGAGLFSTRAALTTHERVRAGEWEPGEALRIATDGPPAYGPSNFRHAVEALAAAPTSADQWANIPACPLHHVRALEAEGRADAALKRCRLGSQDPEAALALARTGHRLARRLRAPWAPVAPLAEPLQRTLTLERAGDTLVASRPAWFALDQQGLPAGGPTSIELAVVDTLRAAGRRCLHAENWLWTGVFALVFRAAYFMPVRGMLPTPRRAGPVDLGSPSFYEKRRAFCDEQLLELELLGLRPFVDRWRGEHLDGLFRSEQVVEHAGELSGPFLAKVLRPLLTFGWSTARGLPDLLVLPGRTARLPHAIPTRIPEEAFFAEIKGPTDALRDGQRLWHDRLVRATIHVELWHVIGHHRI